MGSPWSGGSNLVARAVGAEIQRETGCFDVPARPGEDILQLESVVVRELGR